MKGLRKYLSPFAPDQSGAAAVLCEFHGLIIILDAGGCAGNICGFDEPRWFDSRSAIFSAGLRDMDAILGRDDRLVEKIGKACEKLSADFIAVIGTPVPAVIGTDYKALSRMIEKKTGIPALTIDTDGTKLYDIGEKKTWKELFKKFAVKQEEDCQHEYQDHMLQRFRKFLIITALQHIFQCCKEDKDAEIDPDQCQGKVSVMLIQIRNTATVSDRVGDQE